MSLKNASENKVATPPKYPNTIRFDEDELPEIKAWKVGGKYKITLEVEQTSMSKGTEYEELGGGSKEKPKVRASFKILSASPLGGSNLKDGKRPNMLADAMKKRI